MFYDTVYRHRQALLLFELETVPTALHMLIVACTVYRRGDFGLAVTAS